MPRNRSDYFLSYYQRNKERYKKYYLTNREKLIDNSKKYYKDNINQYKEYFQNYYVENKDYLLEKRRLRNKLSRELKQKQQYEKLKNYNIRNVKRLKDVRADGNGPNPSLFIDFD
jgi:hypothetical protein